MSKISGPLLDRIDIHLQTPALKTYELMKDVPVENSLEIKKRTAQARGWQELRFASKSVYTNAQMDSRQIKEFCQISEEGSALLKKAIETLGLSARGHDKILKVARTIADLAEHENIQTNHIAEAISYRTLDRMM